MNNEVAALAEQTRGLPAEQLLAHVLERFGDRIALASSLGLADQVLADMLCKITPHPHIFTLDTGRLGQETHDTIQATNRKYDIRIEMLLPDRRRVEALVNEHGPNLFRQSVELRKACCQARKVWPMRRRLARLDAWITGLRREQSPTRGDIQPVEWDQANALIKVTPLADWSTQQVWDYIRDHDVPYNKLHDEGYPSIGCAPCTRAVAEGEDIRAGRWWWERPEHKECGLHVVNCQLVRKERQ